MNLVNGSRDPVRNRANDRRMSSNSRRKTGVYNSKTYNSFGVGSNSLKIRPDMNRQNIGMFNKASIDGQERKVKRLNQPKNVLLLQ